MKNLFLIFVVLSSFLIGCSPKMVPPPPHVKSKEEIILAAREQEKAQMYQQNDTTRIDSTKQTWYKDYSDYQDGALQTYSTLTINVDPNPYWSPYFYFGYTWGYPYYGYPYYWGYPYYYGYYAYPYWGYPHHGGHGYINSGHYNGYYGHRPPTNSGPNQKGQNQMNRRGPSQMNQQKREGPNQMNRGQNQPRYNRSTQNYYPGNYRQRNSQEYINRRFQNPQNPGNRANPTRNNGQYNRNNAPRNYGTPSGGYRQQSIPSRGYSPSGGYSHPSGGSGGGGYRGGGGGGGHSGGGHR